MWSEAALWMCGIDDVCVAILVIGNRPKDGIELNDEVTKKYRSEMENV